MVKIEIRLGCRLHASETEFQNGRRCFDCSIGARLRLTICLAMRLISSAIFEFGSDWTSGVPRLIELDRCLVVTGHETDDWFTQKLLDLPQIEIDLLAPAIDDDADFLARVSKPIEDLERSLGAADGGNVERQDQDDLVRLIERGQA